jgi:hypothetical protein
MKVINPHDEIKGSNPSPWAYFEDISDTMESDKSKIPPNSGNLKAQTSTTGNHESYD